MSLTKISFSFFYLFQKIFQICFPPPHIEPNWIDFLSFLPKENKKQCKHDSITPPSPALGAHTLHTRRIDKRPSVKKRSLGEVSEGRYFSALHRGCLEPHDDAGRKSVSDTTISTSMVLCSCNKLSTIAATAFCANTCLKKWRRQRGNWTVVVVLLFANFVYGQQRKTSNCRRWEKTVKQAEEMVCSFYRELRLQ